MTVTVDEQTAMTLRCYVDSNPRSTIKLLNNSQTLRQVTNSTQAEYTWNKAGYLDTGNYTCEADNGIKSAVSKSVQLVVRCEFNIHSLKYAFCVILQWFSGVSTCVRLVQGQSRQ